MAQLKEPVEGGGPLTNTGLAVARAESLGRDWDVRASSRSEVFRTVAGLGRIEQPEPGGLIDTRSGPRVAWTR